jgi:phage-related protein
MAGAVAIAAAWLIAIGPIALVIAAVVGLVVLIVKNWDTIQAATVAVWNAVTSAVTTAVSAVVDFVKAHWPLLLAIITGPIGLAVLYIVSHWDQIKDKTSAAWSAISKLVSDKVHDVLGFVQGLGSIPGKVAGWFGDAKDGASKKLGDLVTYVKGVPGKILSALGSLGHLLYNAGISILSGLLDGLKDKFEDVKNFVGGIGSWIGDHKGPISYDRRLLIPAGNAIMQGLDAGIRSQMGTLQSTLSDVTDLIQVKPYAGTGSMDFASSATRATAANSAPAPNRDDALLAELRGLRDDNVELRKTIAQVERDRQAFERSRR